MTSTPQSQADLAAPAVAENDPNPQAPLPSAPPAGDGPDADALPAPQPSPDRMVPVSESIRYRRRAQQAERRLAELEGELETERAARQSAESNLASFRRRGELSRLLSDRGVIDPDAAVLLAEDRLASADESADLADTIEQLLKDKPYLLGRSATGDGPAADAGPPAAGLTTPTQGRRTANGSAEQLRAAARAAASGRPGDLDRYLRLRRRFA